MASESSSPLVGSDVDEPILRHGRHAFYTPLRFQIPHPADLIFPATIPILEHYNSQSLHHDADPLLIEALSIAPTLFYGCDTTPAVHCLVRFDLFIKVQLKLVCDLDMVWSAGTVMVRDGARWRPLKDWLQTFPSPTIKGYGKAALEQQYNWWRRTGKPFRFPDLPNELQRRILLFAIGEHVEPAYSKDDAGYYWNGGKKEVSLTKGTMHREDHRNCTSFPLIAPVNLALLCLSKQTSKLAGDVLWADTTKTYRSAPHGTTSVTRIELTIDREDLTTSVKSNPIHTATRLEPQQLGTFVDHPFFTQLSMPMNFFACGIMFPSVSASGRRLLPLSLPFASSPNLLTVSELAAFMGYNSATGCRPLGPSIGISGCACMRSVNSFEPMKYFRSAGPVIETPVLSTVAKTLAS